MTVNDKKIGPSVVVDICKHGAPAEGVRVDTESSGKRHVCEGAVAVVVVESGGVV